VLKENSEPVGEIAPAHDAIGGCAGSVLYRLIGRAQGNEDLPPVGTPTGHALVGEALVGGCDATEILVQRLVLRRRVVGIGRRIELTPETGALGGGGLTHSGNT